MGLREYKTEVVAALVLLHIPRLSLFEWRSSSHGEHSLFLEIIHAAAKSEKLHGLESIIFKNTEDDSTDLALKAISPFIGIKSLQSVQATDCHWLNGTSMDGSDQSGVLELGISLCEGNGRVHFETLLKRLPSLQRLDFR